MISRLEQIAKCGGGAANADMNGRRHPQHEVTVVAVRNAQASWPHHPRVCWSNVPTSRLNGTQAKMGNLRLFKSLSSQTRRSIGYVSEITSGGQASTTEVTDQTVHIVQARQYAVTTLCWPWIPNWHRSGTQRKTSCLPIKSVHFQASKFGGSAAMAMNGRPLSQKEAPVAVAQNAIRAAGNLLAHA